jgi:hypothetical protein
MDPFLSMSDDLAHSLVTPYRPPPQLLDFLLADLKVPPGIEVKRTTVGCKIEPRYWTGDRVLCSTHCVDVVRDDTMRLYQLLQSDTPEILRDEWSVDPARLADYMDYLSECQVNYIRGAITDLGLPPLRSRAVRRLVEAAHTAAHIHIDNLNALLDWYAYCARVGYLPTQLTSANWLRFLCDGDHVRRVY